jgi:GT2 family glycosyltransferase
MPSGQVLASVIILGYNGMRYLDDCLSSLQDQDLPGDEYEVIYADNASSDGSAEYVRSHFPFARVVHFDRNWGFAAGNNRAVPGTRGEWIVFLNQDTVCARSWLRKLIEGVSSSPEIAAGHANIIHPWYSDFPGIRERADSPNAYTPVLERWGYLRYRNLGPVGSPSDVFILSGAALALRRSVLQDIGYVFDEDFWAYAEDWDLGFRLRLLGFRTVLVPSATVYHLHTSKTGVRWANWVATMRNLRNRCLAFYKATTWPELLAVWALLTIGAPMNAFDFGLQRRRQVFYSLALVPAALVALGSAILSLRRYAARRREIFHRAGPGSSILKTIWRGPQTKEILQKELV